jgi:DHA3 family macrolide efflux protein-like MFS transporter
MQGRVMSLVNSGATAISPLGLLVAGPFSDWLGIRVWYWAGGMICILIAVSAFFIPVIMNVEPDTPATQVPASETV